MRKYFILPALLFFSINVSAQDKTKHKTEKQSRQKNKLIAEYAIDAKKVSQKEFEDFLASLTEMEKTWFCAETQTGGRTGYNAKDKNGIVYEYRVKSDLNNSANSITKK